ncbi:MAG: T9SS type A sorting domain-containing protein [bacterium]|nr:T9SS type A sorting domain-containing protein [bacterium]
MRKLLLVLAVVVCVGVGRVTAQPCNASTYVNPAPGSSTCVIICPGSILQIHVFGPLGPNQTPVFGAMMTCNPWPASLCDFECPFPPNPVFFTYDPVAWTYNSADGSFDNFIYGTGEGCLCLTFEGILGAELLGFDASAGDNTVMLTWRTASETDNEAFEIHRDGAKIGEVSSSGNTTSGHSYSWIDDAATNGVPYTYRLLARDVHGTLEELGVASATPQSGAGLVTGYALHGNYPNPFNPTTTISFDLAAAGHATLKVLNIQGQEIATLVNGQLLAGSHVSAFDATGLPSGMYFTRLEVNGFTATEKMLLLK